MMTNRMLLKLAIKKNHPNTRCTIVDGVITRWGDIINPTGDEKPDEATLIEEFRVEGDLLDIKANWVILRTERDSLLASSDWTQYNDSPLDNEAKAGWMTYRRELRDLPESVDLADPTWPEAPE